MGRRPESDKRISPLVSGKVLIARFVMVAGTVTNAIYPG